MLCLTSTDYWTVRVRVVVCTIVPDVAVTVTVDVPAAAGVVMDAVFAPPQPAMVKLIARRVSVPPHVRKQFRILRRRNITGRSAARPRGRTAATAITLPKGEGPPVDAI